MTRLTDAMVERLRKTSREVVDGRYEIEREAGCGGMGTVYKAVDLTTNELVALKVLRSGRTADARRFEREASLLAKLQHPAIVGYVAHGKTEDDELYLVMEWLEGEGLSERLAHAPLSVRDTLTVARRITEALSVAHAQSIVHRDLKPSNVFLCDGEPGRAKVVDFGVARLRDFEHELTQTGQVVGTPGYMAPEQARGDETVDERADLFSLGSLLYRCLTRRPAFEGKDVLSVLAKLVLHDPAPVRTIAPEVPFELEDLVARLLSKTPEERPATAAEVRRELDTIAAVMDGGAPTRRDGARSAPASQTPACLVMARSSPDAESPSDEEVDQARAEAEGLGGSLQKLGAATFVVTIRASGDGAPGPAEAERIAKCARLLAELLGAPAIALAPVQGAAAWGGTIEAASELLAGAKPGSVRLAPSPGERVVVDLSRALDSVGLPLSTEIDIDTPLAKTVPAGGGRDAGQVNGRSLEDQGTAVPAATIATIVGTRPKKAAPGELPPTQRAADVRPSRGGRSKRWTPPRVIAAVAALVVVAGLVVLVVRWRKGSGEPDGPGAVAPPPTTGPIGERERDVARRACKSWAESLAAEQRPDGSFGMEKQRKATIWDTGQELTALTAARAACDGVGPAPIRNAVQAITARQAAGEGKGFTPVHAWSAIALLGASAVLQDESLHAPAIAARDAMLDAQLPSGAFAFSSKAMDEPLNEYSSVLGFWALVEVEAASPTERAVAARRAAAAWLRTALREDVGDPPLRRVPGLHEQAIWALVRARQLTGDRDPEDDALYALVARELLDRCDLEGEGKRACRHPMHGDGQVFLERGPGSNPNLSTLWHPWVTAAAYALASETSIALPAAVRSELWEVARWGVVAIENGIALYGAVASYKLAEELHAMSQLLHEPSAR